MHVTSLRTVTFADLPAFIQLSSETAHSMAQNIVTVTQSFPTQPPSPFQQKLPQIKAQDRIEGSQFKLATQQQIEQAIER